ncbi:MAG: hypothetical protein KatS3mg076_0508 [Candidatus Binatia bacterium]|nr:MAG: hypothetical protein KatS3mg076_0508 [Candidatus Binatia bacterium]
MTATPTEVVGPVCGNAVVEEGEECETDADCAEGETCTAECLCEAAAVCGNGVVEGGEECETDADCAEGETCSAECLCEGAPAALGEREFPIVKNPANMKTVFLTSAAGFLDVGSNMTGILRLTAGTPDENGVAQLALAEDGYLAIGIPLGGLGLCMKFEAAGSTGFVDCDGGSVTDVRASRNSNGADPGGPTVFEVTGEPSGPGNAVLDVMVSTVQLDGNSAPTVEECMAQTYPPAEQFVFSTSRIDATIENPRAGTSVTSASREGEAFDCSNWTQADGPGALVSAVIAEDAPIVNIDVIQLLGMGAN